MSWEDEALKRVSKQFETPKPLTPEAFKLAYVARLLAHKAQVSASAPRKRTDLNSVQPDKDDQRLPSVSSDPDPLYPGPSTDNPRDDRPMVAVRPLAVDNKNKYHERERSYAAGRSHPGHRTLAVNQLPSCCLRLEAAMLGHNAGFLQVSILFSILRNQHRTAQLVSRPGSV